MKIQSIELSHHTMELDPPFPAAWDPAPRKSFTTSIVRVITDEGLVGVGAGDMMYGFKDYVHLFLGQDPFQFERHYTVLNSISFHASRCWPLDLALWDLYGKAKGEPVYKLLGGHTDRLETYASSACLRGPEETVEVAQRFRERGFKAMKIRFGRKTIEDDIAVIQSVRKAMGDAMEIMVDLNQGWRMPYDVDPLLGYDKALHIAKEMEKLDVYWVEEALYRSEYKNYKKLRDQVNVRLSGGEMHREDYELQNMMEFECVDVLQPDCTLTGGITGLSKIARECKERGLIFTPHTWGNGIGLIANAHLTAGTVGTTYLELPYDPPEWSPARRDFALKEPIETDSEGVLHLSDKPGFGLELDEDRLGTTLTDLKSWG